MSRWSLALLLSFAFACGPAAPAQGQLRAPGVGEAHFEVRANGTDLVPVRLVYPANDDGTPVPGPHPAIVLLQGGFVETPRYLWQADALARAGYVVALPGHLLNLAFFSIENGEATRRLLVAPPAGSLLEGLVDRRRVAVAGHSLGGVVAMKLLLAGGFGAGVVQASFADPADEARLASLTAPTLFLAAEGDCQARLAEIEASWAKVPGPTALVVLEGATHFQFTGSDAPDAERGCPPVTGLDEAHARIEAAMLGFLGAALGGGGVGEAALRAVPGAEVRAR